MASQTYRGQRLLKPMVHSVSYQTFSISKETAKEFKLKKSDFPEQRTSIDFVRTNILMAPKVNQEKDVMT